jgi:hypothetical protein
VSFDQPAAAIVDTNLSWTNPMRNDSDNGMVWILGNSLLMSSDRHYPGIVRATQTEESSTP